MRKKASAGNGDSDYHVPNLERALVVMEFLAQNPGAGVSRIAEALRLPKNSVFRISMSLLRHGYVLRDEETKAFFLSHKLLALGYAATNKHTVVENSMDVMRELRDKTRETVLLGALLGTEGVVLEQVFGSYPFKFMVDAGTRFSLHTSAPGKALLAFLPAREQETVLRGLKLTRYTARTITTLSALRAELQRVRECGYGEDRAEEIEGCHCVGAAILDQHNYPVASVWLTGPSNRVPLDSFPRLGELVKEHAGRISSRLGHGLVPSGNSTNLR
ncbi:MAG: IclR family transcriptional regulator [Planctomycetota bacterium]|nr:IclR family transcriptional regulator [Planctomycetota bacterium]